MSKQSAYQRFVDTSYSGRDLLKKYSLEDEGTWQVCGEDPNCDMGGHHSNPYLGTFSGKLKDVIKIAVGLPGFFTWGGGGNLKRINIVVVEDGTAEEQDELKNQITDLEGELEFLKSQLIK